MYWETVEIFTNCELEPEEKKYSQIKEGDEIGMILDSKDENYWETAEAVTNYEPEPKKDFHLHNKRYKTRFRSQRRDLLGWPTRHKGQRYEKCT